jgi:hypothetical protein
VPLHFVYTSMYGSFRLPHNRLPCIRLTLLESEKVSPIDRAEVSWLPWGISAFDRGEREMDKSYVRNELFAQAMEVGEFEVFPAPSEAEGELDNSFLISTGMLLGVPKVFIVRVEEFHYSQEEEDNETDKILQDQERHIKRVLSEHEIVLSEAAWNTVFSYAVLDVHPSRTSGRLSEDEVRSVEEAFDALGLDP